MKRKIFCSLALILGFVYLLEVDAYDWNSRKRPSRGPRAGQQQSQQQQRPSQQRSQREQERRRPEQDSELSQRPTSSICQPELLPSEIKRVTNEKFEEGRGARGTSPDSWQAQISGDGCEVVFRSKAINFGPDRDPYPDVFVFDRIGNKTTLLSKKAGNGGGPLFARETYNAISPSLSSDRKAVAYISKSRRIVDGGIQGGESFNLLLHNRDRDNDNLLDERERGAVYTEVVTLGANQSGGSIAPNGNTVVAVASNAEPSLYVVFQSLATNLISAQEPLPEEDNFQIYLYNKSLQRIVPVSVDLRGNLAIHNKSYVEYSHNAISADGYSVVFRSSGEDLTNGSPDPRQTGQIYMRDIPTGITSLVSGYADGTNSFVKGNKDSNSATITPDGRFVVFASSADNLVAAESDTNNAADIFLWERNAQNPNKIRRISKSHQGGLTNGYSWKPDISADGRYIVYMSRAMNIVQYANNNIIDVFVTNVQTGEQKRLSEKGRDIGDGNSLDPTISDDGRWIAFVSEATNLSSQDTNNAKDVFVMANPLYAPAPPQAAAEGETTPRDSSQGPPPPPPNQTPQPSGDARVSGASPPAPSQQQQSQQGESGGASGSSTGQAPGSEQQQQQQQNEGLRGPSSEGASGSTASSASLPSPPPIQPQTPVTNPQHNLAPINTETGIAGGEIDFCYDTDETPGVYQQAQLSTALRTPGRLYLRNRGEEVSCAQNSACVDFCTTLDGMAGTTYVVVEHRCERTVNIGNAIASRYYYDCRKAIHDSADYYCQDGACVPGRR